MAEQTEELSADEKSAKHLLTVATQHVGTAYGELIGVQGGIDFAGIGLNQQLVTMQLDALMELLFEQKVLDRAKYWHKCAQKMRMLEKGIRDAILAQPRIQVPGAPPSKVS